MKKILSCLLAVLLLASLSVSAFAAEVPSVEAEKLVPTVSEAKDADEKDVADGVVITDYEDKDALPEEAQKQLDAAYDALEDLAALVEGNDDLKELLDGKEADAESVFDISIVGDEIKLPVELKLELVNPDNFAALLHFVDGEATLIESELEDGVLTAVIEELGTYAILSFVEAE